MPEKFSGFSRRGIFLANTAASIVKMPDRKYRPPRRVPRWPAVPPRTNGNNAPLVKNRKWKFFPFVIACARRSN